MPDRKNEKNKTAPDEKKKNGWIVAIVVVLIGTFGTILYQRFCGAGCCRRNLEEANTLQSRRQWKDSITKLTAAVECGRDNEKGCFASAMYLRGFAKCMAGEGPDAALEDFRNVPTTSSEFTEARKYLDNPALCKSDPAAK